MAANPGLPPASPSPTHLSAARIAALSEPRVGDVCPACQAGRLDYDGLLNLACAQCGYSLSGCFT